MNTDIHQEDYVMTKMREPSWFNRIVSAIVIISLGGLTVVPGVAAAQQEIEQALTQAEAAELSPVAEISGAVVSIMSELAKIQAKLEAAEDEESKKAVDISEEEESLEKLSEKLTDLDEEIMTDFNEIGTLLEDKDLPDVIVDRHEQAVEKYQNELAAVLDGVERIRETTDQKMRFKHTTELAGRLNKMKHKRSQQHFDPAELPSRSLKPNVDNKPKQTALEFILADPVGDARNLMASTGDSLPTGDDAFTNPDWLSESDEVVLTQSIIDKAAELGDDPVIIYHWVRNNIQWNPNWGAKQTAQLTMELGSGNAMDIASLTIGLMRAANIPARYVHGTIDVPEDRYRNWAGGFEDIDAAIDYGASGGIPLGPVTSGGLITKVRMEHIWVEIAVDYLPSRAATNSAPDSWIAIDPSFKQYTYRQSLNPITIAGLDPDQIQQDFVSSSAGDSAEGWIVGYDTSILDAPQNQAQTAVENYIASNLSNPATDDVIGGARTTIQAFPGLGASLPNAIIVDGAKYGSLTSGLQQKMTFAFDVDTTGELVDPTTFSWAELNNQKITLAFSPATPADEAALLSLLPEEGVTNVNQFPGTVPAYLVNVIPEIRVSGVLVKSGNIMSLGNEIDFRFNPDFVGFGTIPNRYSVIAGSYLSLAVVSNGVSSTRLEALQADVQDTMSVYASGDSQAINEVTREQLMGDAFHAATLGYYHFYSTLSEIAARPQSAYHTLAAGVGSFGYEPSADLLFGVPRTISAGGGVGNLPMIRIIGVDSSDQGQAKTTKKDFNLFVGLLSSAVEHAIPEMLFNYDPSSTSNAISAVKALQIANSQGQRIYHLTQQNMALSFSNINLDNETESEIQQAISSGKEVITHTDPVSVPGYVGAGYIIFDPITGDGAYKIAGGFDGVVILILAAAFFAAVLPLAIATYGFAYIAGFASVTYSSWSVLDDVTKIVDQCNDVDVITALIPILTLAFLSAAVKFEEQIRQAVFDATSTSATLNFADFVIDETCTL